MYSYNHISKFKNMFSKKKKLVKTHDFLKKLFILVYPSPLIQVYFILALFQSRGKL